MIKAYETQPGTNSTKTDGQALVKMFFDMFLSVKKATNAGLAWEQQYRLGQYQKLENNSVQTGVMLRNSVKS